MLKGVVRITQSESLRFSSPFMATCPLAIGMAFFEHQYLQPAAAELYDRDSFSSACDYLRCVLPKNGLFCAGQIVLGKLANALE